MVKKVGGLPVQPLCMDDRGGFVDLCECLVGKENG